MAQALFRSLAAEQKKDFTCSSAGFSPHLRGMAYHPICAEECAKHGVAFDGQSRTVEPGDLLKHNLIIAMDRATLNQLWAMDPIGENATKFYLLGEFDSQGKEDRLEIEDPITSPKKDFTRLYETVRRCCEQLVKKLSALRENECLPPSRALKVLEGRGAPGQDLAEGPAQLARFQWLKPIVEGKKILVLDFGSGEGAALLSGFAHHVISVERGGNVPELEEKFSSWNLLFVDGGPLDLVDLKQKFDVVVALGMISCILRARLPLFLDQVDRALAEGGCFVSSCPNQEVHRERDVGGFRPKELSALLRGRFSSVRLIGNYSRRKRWRQVVFSLDFFNLRMFTKAGKAEVEQDFGSPQCFSAHFWRQAETTIALCGKSKNRSP
jgi:protein-tyrosine-phosphatase